MAVGDAAQATDEEIDDTNENEGGDQNEDEGWQVILREVDELVVPAYLDTFQALLAGHGWIQEQRLQDQNGSDSLSIAFQF